MLFASSKARLGRTSRATTAPLALMSLVLPLMRRPSSPAWVPHRNSRSRCIKDTGGTGVSLIELDQIEPCCCTRPFWLLIFSQWLRGVESEGLVSCGYSPERCLPRPRHEMWNACRQLEGHSRGQPAGRFTGCLLKPDQDRYIDVDIELEPLR